MRRPLLACLAGPLLAAAASAEPADLEQRLTDSVEALRTMTAVHARWGLGREARWFVDQDLGTIRFDFADGRGATAPVQIVGTYSRADGTFLWAWDHPGVAEALSADAKRVRDYGERNDVAAMTTKLVRISEDDAWRYTAFAALLSGASGAHRADSGGPLVFVTFGEVSISKKPRD